MAAGLSGKIPVGVSSCLLGERVRYDGGHKRHDYVVESLGKCFEFHPFCPEFAIGLGVPRKPIQLTRDGTGELRCVQVDDPRVDHGRALRDSLDVERIQRLGLCGYILKKGSPSCGMEAVPVWRGENPMGESSGIFAHALMQAFPWLPVEDEGRLGEAPLRDNFIQRVFVLRRWFALMDEWRSKPGPAALTRFHARHKLIIMSCDPASYPTLGRLLAEAGKDDLASIAERYLSGLMAALGKPATPGRHGNVLLHVLGYLKHRLDRDEREALRQGIDDFREGRVPLQTPISLLNRQFSRHPDPYIADSWYMNPEPGEKALRSGS